MHFNLQSLSPTPHTLPQSLYYISLFIFSWKGSVFFFTSAAPPSSVHRLDYAQGINPGWAVRSSSLQDIVLVQNSKVLLQMLENPWLLALHWMGSLASAGRVGQSMGQESKGWGRTMILWLRQLTATLESDLDCKTKSLILGEWYITQTKCFTGLRSMQVACSLNKAFWCDFWMRCLCKGVSEKCPPSK